MATGPVNPEASGFIDIGNPHLAVVPSRMDTGTIMTPKGMRGVVTTRTSSATVTVLLTRTELLQRAQILTDLAKLVTDSNLIIGGSGSLNGG